MMLLLFKKSEPNAMLYLFCLIFDKDTLKNGMVKRMNVFHVYRRHLDILVSGKVAPRGLPQGAKIIGELPQNL